MKKLLLWVALLCLPAATLAQTHTFPATDTNNVFTGTNTFDANMFTKLVSYTVSTLPAPGTVMVGMLAVVTDSSAACASGGGTTIVLCRNNGSTWDAFASGGGGGTPGSPANSVQYNSGGGFGGASGVTTNGNSVYVKGPVPYRDATAYGAVSSTQTFTATSSSGSPNVTINTAGDWKNGQAISILGAGAAATVTAPNVTAINITAISRTTNVVTATVASVGPIVAGQFIQVAGYTAGHVAFNGVFWTQTSGGTSITWNQTGANDTATTGTVTPGVALYEGTNAGATTHNYTACSVGAGGGCSAKSAQLTVTNAPATLTNLDYVWLYFGNAQAGGATGMPLGADYLCVYRDSTFIGRANVPGYKDDGELWARNANCPSSPPSAATADTLTTTITSGAGTTSLVAANNAGTSGSGLYTFHDSAPAINAAAADVGTDVGGKPNVILPAGRYYLSRVVVSAYRLDVTGEINLTTHPLRVSGGGTLQGHGANLLDAVNYNTDDQAAIFSTTGVDGVTIAGGGGGNTVRGLAFPNTAGHDVSLLANTLAGGNGITIENITGSHFSAGDCLWSDSNIIFVKIKNLRCGAADIANGAATNRYAMYISNVWAAGSWVDWDLEDIFFDFGEIYLDSPAPTLLSGAASQFRENTIKGYKGEGGLSKGFLNIDSGCTQAAMGANNQITFSYPHFENFGDSDRAAYKAFFYYPRLGSTGCTQAIVEPSNLVYANIAGGPTTVIDPIVGGDVSSGLGDASIGQEVNANVFGDQNLLAQSTRIGTARFITGQPFITWKQNISGTDEVSSAYQMASPAFFVSDDGAGATSCVAGTTYYFKISITDGTGWTKVDQTTPETSGTASTNGNFIGVFYGSGYETNPWVTSTYRIWFGTTAGGENQYKQTTSQTFYNFDCTAGTVATPPVYTTAFWYKIPTRTGDPAWFGTRSTDTIGIGKTNPSYLLDVAGIASLDKALVFQETTAASGISSADVCWGDSTLHGPKCKNNNGAAVPILFATGALTPGNCLQIVDGHTAQDNGSPCGAGGTGTVTSFSANAITTGSQNFATAAVATASTTPALTFTLANAPAHKALMNNSGSAAAPDYEAIGAGDLPATTVNSVVNDTNVTGSIVAQALTLGWTGTLGAARGGTAQSSYTKGDTLCPSAATTITKLAVGSNTQVLTADSTQTCGIKWATPSTGLTIDTNSGANSSQVLLNFTNTSGASGISFTNPSGGVESASLVNVAGGGNSTLQGTLTSPAQGDVVCENGSTILVNCTLGIPGNSQVGTTYTVLTTDRGKTIIICNASAIAVTLPQAGGTGFGSNFFFTIKNDCNGNGTAGAAGAVTITPTTSTVDGKATLLLLEGMSASISSQDNVNYESFVRGYASRVSGSISGAIVGIACDTGTVTINGAATSSGMVATVTPNTYPGAGLTWQAYVSGANTVTVAVCSDVTVTPTASTYNVNLATAAQ